LAAPDPGASHSTRPALHYRGRFAPSPTGPLHIGSVTAALASFLDARASGGAWLVRMEDLDPPREVAGAADDILRTLERLGLHWDESVVYQSQRIPAYQAALDSLRTAGVIYGCRCSRQDLVGADIYPGACRSLNLSHDGPVALRCAVPAQPFQFSDRLQGPYAQNLARDVGDFILRRRDGYFAYQLAVVVDDSWQHITDVVRGIDLLDSTPRQLYLQHQLGLTVPRYAHIPVITNMAGQKLGKQQLATAVDGSQASAVLLTALTYLQQEPDPRLAGETVENLLAWAIDNWTPARLCGVKSIVEKPLA
jgi:glutamyl-Q tRNA(Asp) synthetase